MFSLARLIALASTTHRVIVLTALTRTLNTACVITTGNRLLVLLPSKHWHRLAITSLAVQVPCFFVVLFEYIFLTFPRATSQSIAACYELILASNGMLVRCKLRVQLDRRFIFVVKCSVTCT